MEIDLRRLVTRHRHVAPMLSALLAGTDARVVVTDAAGEVILHREGSGPAGAISTDGHRFPILLEGQPVGWVEGGRVAAAVAAVLGYAAAREHDKRALAQEALERYRELNLIYDLADEIGSTLESGAVAAVALREAGRLPAGGTGFLLLATDGSVTAFDGSLSGDVVAAARAGSGILRALLDGEAEIVNDVASDPRAVAPERAFASLVAAPLKAGEARIGLIGAVSAAPTEYHAADLKVLTAIAALAALALNHAAAYEAAVRASGRG